MKADAEKRKKKKEEKRKQMQKKKKEKRKYLSFHATGFYKSRGLKSNPVSVEKGGTIKWRCSA